VLTFTNRFAQLRGNETVHDPLQEVKEGFGAVQVAPVSVPAKTGLLFANEHQHDGVMDKIDRLTLAYHTLDRR
jgi:hypothetical protein